MSFKRVFFKNIVGLAKYTYTSQIISFVSSIATARLILPESFGLIALITVFTGFINVFLDSGISMAVIRSGFGFTYYKGLHTLTCLISILLCTLTIIMLYPISLFYKNSNLIPPGIAIGILFIFKSLTIVPTAILQKQMEFIYVAKILLVGTVLNIAFTIIMAIFGWQEWALIWPQYISTICIFSILNKKTRLPLLFVRRAVVVSSFLKTKSLIGNLVGFNLINYWSRNTDNLLVGKVYGATELGIYNRA
ncbi:MAG: oligosaccharide flippase family protein, partial [Ferruginibacter sp.]